jgi:hypothetical protein
LNKPLDERRSGYVEFKQGCKTGSEAADVTSMRRCEEKPGANRAMVGVQNSSFGVLSLDHDADKPRLQGNRQDESLDAVAI